MRTQKSLNWFNPFFRKRKKNNYKIYGWKMCERLFFRFSFSTSTLFNIETSLNCDKFLIWYEKKEQVQWKGVNLKRVKASRSLSKNRKKKKDWIQWRKMELLKSRATETSWLLWKMKRRRGEMTDISAARWSEHLEI